MSRNEIAAQLTDIFKMVVNPNVNTDALTEDTNFVTELGVNSIGLLYMAIAIEKQFGVDLSEVSVQTFRTVGDVIDYIEKNGNKE